MEPDVLPDFEDKPDDAPDNEEVCCLFDCFAAVV